MLMVTHRGALHLGLSDVVIHSNHPAATGAAGLGAETMSCADTVRSNSGDAMAILGGWD